MSLERLKERYAIFIDYTTDDETVYEPFELFQHLEYAKNEEQEDGEDTKPFDELIGNTFSTLIKPYVEIMFKDKYLKLTNQNLNVIYKHKYELAKSALELKSYKAFTKEAKARKTTPKALASLIVEKHKEELDKLNTSLDSLETERFNIKTLTYCVTEEDVFKLNDYLNDIKNKGF